MQKISDVTAGIDQKAFTTAKTNIDQKDQKVFTANPVSWEKLDTVCESDSHAGRAVQKMMVDGVELCPVCYREEQDQKLSADIQEQIQQQEERRRMRYLTQHSLLEDEGALESGFRNYHADKDTQAYQNKAKMMQVAKAYADQEVFNTWLYGNAGAGKTHLAMATIRNIQETTNGRMSCLFVNTNKLMQQIRQTFSKEYASTETEQSYIQRCSEPDVLVLDDLGAESGRIGKDNQASDFVHRVLYAISNERLHKSTIITTNLTFCELERLYDAKLMSRLKNKHRILEFTEIQDYRSQAMEEV